MGYAAGSSKSRPITRAARFTFRARGARGLRLKRLWRRLRISSSSSRKDLAHDPPQPHGWPGGGEDVNDYAILFIIGHIWLAASVCSMKQLNGGWTALLGLSFIIGAFVWRWFV